MAEKIVLETEIKTGNSASSVKSVKQELRSLQAELSNLEIGSEAFTIAAQKAAGLRDKIDDAAAGVKAFNPEAKFAAFAGVLGGVANGFAAAQGAMALFGTENKDIEQAILKTQGAMALATGLSGLGGMADAVGLLASKIKVQLVTAFSSLKSAMIATGIGALIVAIGLAINAVMEYNQAIDDETNAQEKLNDELKKTQDLMEAQVTGTEKLKNAKKGGLDDLKREKELLEAKGATEKEIFDKSQEIAKAELANLKTRRESGLEATKEIADKENEIKAQQLAYDKFVEDERDKNAKDAADKRKAAKEKADAKAKADKEKADKEFTEEMYEQIEAQKILNESLAQMDRQAFEDTMLQYDAVQKTNKEVIALDKAKKEAQLESFLEVSNALKSYAQLADSHTVAAKGIAVATTAIDTYVAAQKAYTSQLVPGDPTSPLRGLFFAGAAVASGLANVRKILAVNKNSTPTPTASSTSVPQFNPAVAQQVQGGGDIQLGMKPQKVYVVESDIRGSMNKVDVIQSNAKIG
jgi:hypothetical protein